MKWFKFSTAKEEEALAQDRITEGVRKKQEGLVMKEILIAISEDGRWKRGGRQIISDDVLLSPLSPTHSQQPGSSLAWPKTR